MYIRSEKKREVQYEFSNGDIQTFSMSVAAIVTKFEFVFTVVNDFLFKDTKLKTEYEKFLREYIKADDRMKVFLKHVNKLITLIDKNFDASDIANNINVKEDSRFSINVTHEESALIIKSSVRTRFFLFCYLSDISLTPDQQKVLHSYICREMLDTGVVDKLYKILNSIVLSTYPNKGGKKLWDLMSSTGGYSSDSHALKLMSSMFYKSLPSLDPSDNPIAYMISIAKNEMDWLLRTNFSINVLNSYIDTDSVTTPTNNGGVRLLENEVYYRTIVQKCFNPVYDEYYAYRKLNSYNLYPTMFNISQPLIHKIFNISLSNISFDNLCSLNFYVHKFLKKYDPDKTILMDMLLSIPAFSNRGTNEVPEDIKLKVQDALVSKRGQKIFPFLSHTTIKKIFVEAVSALYKYRYIDPITGNDREIIWDNLINQYVSYIYSIQGPYKEFIEKEIDSLRSIELQESNELEESVVD